MNEIVMASVFFILGILFGRWTMDQEMKTILDELELMEAELEKLNELLREYEASLVSEEIRP